MPVDRRFLLAASISAFIAIAAGAFGAHGLKAVLGPASLGVFETAARYQMYHALALFVVSLFCTRQANAMAVDPVANLARIAGWCFIAGTVLFSGSLYGLALTGIGALGAITPLGGLAFLAGWACLALVAWRWPQRMK